jgi:SAM-dependent methyltransferase
VSADERADVTAPTGQERPSNEIKFDTANPLVQRMIGGFFKALREVVEPMSPQTVLDAGCGEGETIARLGGLLESDVTAVDISPYCVRRVADRLPYVEVLEASVAELPFADDAFDLVLCLEVLEHLDDPRSAVSELSRVGARDIVISVPHEPWFRLGSLLRGKYVRSLGNHPEHVNHFNRRSLAQLLEPAVELDDIRIAFPWLIASGRVRAPATRADTR